VLDLLALNPHFQQNGVLVIITELPLERRIITSAFKSYPADTLLFVYLSELSILILSSSDHVNASDMIKSLTETFGGKGGGGPKVAQGTLAEKPKDLETFIKIFIKKKN
jgi:alanyl-tRNA synthetase